jgi:23S rRNA (guanosine2251-2'-O)-methyltransferase
MNQFDKNDQNRTDEELPADRLEGRNPILEALKAGRPINKLYVQRSKEKPDATLARIIHEAKEAGAVIMEVERQVLDQMSVTHGHQGVIAHVAMHEYAELADVLAKAKDAGEDPFLIILDELKESYNLGSVLRIADAAGVHGVIIPKRRSVGLDAAVAKASAGAIEYVPVIRVVNLSQTIAELKTQGFWIAGTDSAGQSDYHAIDWRGPMAVVIGSEGEGIAQQIRKHCDFLIAVPLRGKVNSLNAAVATGIVVFEAMHQRHTRRV